MLLCKLYDKWGSTLFDQFKKSLSKFVKKVSLKEFSEKELNNFSEELRELLIKNEVAVSTANEICSLLVKKLLKTERRRFSNPKPIILSALKDVLLQVLTPEKNIDIVEKIEQSKQERRPFTIAFFGVNGVGKTLAIAKLGNYFKSKGFSCVFAASDTYRAGSIQQLKIHGDKLKIKVIAQDYGSDAAAVAFDAVNHALAKNVNVVLIDTAGRIETNINLMEELRKICRVVEPDLKIFVGDALTGNALISQVMLFNNKIGIDGSILNKVDAVKKGGAAVSIIDLTKKPILFLGTGQKYTDLIPFDAKKLVQQLLF